MLRPTQSFGGPFIFYTLHVLFAAQPVVFCWLRNLLPQDRSCAATCSALSQARACRCPRPPFPPLSTISILMRVSFTVLHAQSGMRSRKHRICMPGMLYAVNSLQLHAYGVLQPRDWPSRPRLLVHLQCRSGRESIQDFTLCHICSSSSSSIVVILRQHNHGVALHVFATAHDWV